MKAECDGCNVDYLSVKFYSYINDFACQCHQVEKFYSTCPCRECLVKILCRETCDIKHIYNVKQKIVPEDIKKGSRMETKC